MKEEETTQMEGIMTRRRFIQGLLRGGAAGSAGALLLSGLLHPQGRGRAFAQDWLEGSGPALKFKSPSKELSTHPALFYDKLINDRVKCRLCPKECQVADRERGFCGVRENLKGEYFTLVYGKPCAVHVDPIEKKPLFHYLPATRSFSIATAGCNFECRFCQNWEISQFRPEQVEYFDLLPGAVVEYARSNRCSTIAFTYTEPVIFYEYMLDTARLSRRENIPGVMISNGFIKREPMEELLKFLGAIKIDFKAFTDKFFRDYCSGELKPVLDILVTIKKSNVWFEMVTLIIPTLNDSEKENRDMCRWILENLGMDIPLHFTRFHPTYKIRNLPPTPVKTLERLREMAMAEGLRYVYLGNVPGHSGENTRCHNCGKILIKRTGFFVGKKELEGGRCRYCKTKIPGVFGL